MHCVNAEAQSLAHCCAAMGAGCVVSNVINKRVMRTYIRTGTPLSCSGRPRARLRGLNGQHVIIALVLGALRVNTDNFVVIVGNHE